MHLPSPSPDDFQTLLDLVRCSSPSGQEAPAVAYLVGRMAELGFDRAEVDPAGNAVGLVGAGPRQIVLLGHIDTVPGEIPVRVEGDRLYGRGATDAKGALAAFVGAAAGAGASPGWQLVVIGAVDEERDSAGARHIRDQYQPELAIIGEPSRWDRVTLGYKGCAWAQVTVRKPGSHAAGGEETAPEAAVALWGKIQAWAQEYNAQNERVFEQASPSLLGLESGEDGFGSWASLQVQIRLPLSLPPETWQGILEELAAPAEVRAPGYPIPAYRGEKNTPLVRAFLGSIRYAGGKPRFVLKSGTADLNIVAPEWGCPALAYGPGDSAQDHTPDEYISLAEFARARDVLSAVLRRLMAG